LSLLVLGIGADDPHHPAAADDAALVTDLLDGRSPLHRSPQCDPAIRVSVSLPSSVTRIVCSKCAASEPSAVTAVHSSSSMRTSGRPAVTIGSTANTMPGSRRGP